MLLTVLNHLLFLSTLSLRRATIESSRAASFQHHFYPRSPCGERLPVDRAFFHQPDFYPRSPCGERHISLAVADLGKGFLSTLSLRRATHYDNYNLHCVEISIHALLAESDPSIVVTIPPFSDFYPRSPCGERLYVLLTVLNHLLFLSTLSLRRATARRESRQQPAGISIHALLAESDVR